MPHFEVTQGCWHQLLTHPSGAKTLVRPDERDRAARELRPGFWDFLPSEDGDRWRQGDGESL